jgi:excisionase family DNA binding protein
MSGREYLSVGEAAELLGVNPKTVRAEIARGRLPAVQVGRVIRIRRDHIDERLAVEPELPDVGKFGISRRREVVPVGEFTRLAREAYHH